MIHLENRRILLLASVESVSAKELATRLGVSGPTINRWLDMLQRYDLVSERVQIDDQGYHYHTYETNLEAISFEIEDGEFITDIQLHSRPRRPV